ncbi:MAG: hypothetical protein IJI11_00180 [Mogibacterium sp.]|nr:hypothetical protein [Mogibacterium sp.]
MNNYRLRNLIFLTLCCDMGLFAKRLIAPVANIITDFIRIPGGIGTSFSLMFLVLAAGLISIKGCATLMGFVQSMIALSLGMIGSMGALSPIGYIVPGIIIDLVFAAGRKTGVGNHITMVAANMLSAAAAGLTANIIVFHLAGVPLALYIVVALASGALCGTLSCSLAGRLRPILTVTAGGRAERKEIAINQ